MKTYRDRTRSNSSDSDVEIITPRAKTAVNRLFQYELWQCEFCDKSFINRYSILRHNIRHIIIPLIRQETYQCDECLHHFTSIKDLVEHTVKKHKDLVNNEDTHEHTNEIENMHTKEIEDIKDVPAILQSIVDKEVFIKCEDELKDVFAKCNELRNKTNGTIETFDLTGSTEDLYQKDIEEPLANLKEEIDDYLSSRTVSPKEEIVCSPRPLTPKEEVISSPKSERPSSPTDEEKESLRHRLLFEEDLEDNLFKDISAECQVNLETLCQQVSLDYDDTDLTNLDHNGLDLETNLESNGLEVNGVDTAKATTDLLNYGNAIHYDFLVDTEECFCKWCGKSFPNRFKLLQHESKHLKVKPKQFRTPLCCICERFIAGNYHNMRRHMVEKHPEKSDLNITYTTHNCPRCRLKYHNYKNHLRRCHDFYKCDKCNNGFESIQLLNNHDCNPSAREEIPNSTRNFCEPGPLKMKCKTSIIKLCEMCFSFIKIRMHSRTGYEVVGEKCEVGVRQICDKCRNLFFEVKLVKRRVRVADEAKLRPMTKPMTNEDRLKKIQNRLKMMNKR